MPSNNDTLIPNANGSTAQPYVQRFMRGTMVDLEPQRISIEQPKNMDLSGKRQEFESWKCDTPKFDWEMFALPQGHFDGHEGGLKCTASNVFRIHAKGIIKKQEWRKFDGLKLWAFLPEKYKSEWKTAANKKRAAETARSPPSRAKVPNFKNVDSYINESCAYFAFPAEAGPSTSQTLDGNNKTADTSAQIFPISCDNTLDTPYTTIVSSSVASGSTGKTSLDTLDLSHLPNFGNASMSTAYPASPDLCVQKPPPASYPRTNFVAAPQIPKFNFGVTSNFDFYAELTSSTWPAKLTSSSRNEEEPPAKRRKRNPKGNLVLKDSIIAAVSSPTRCAFNYSNDSLTVSGPSFAPTSQILMTQKQINSPLNRFSILRGQDPDYEAAASDAPTWSNAVTPSSSPAPQQAPTLIDHEIASWFIPNSINLSEYPSPSNVSVTGSSQPDDENAWLSVSGTGSDLFSSLAGPPMAEHLLDSLLESLERSTSEFPGAFEF